AHDPLFFDKVAIQPLDEDEVPEVSFPHASTRRDGDAFAAAFDKQLNGRVAQLVDASPNAESVIAEAVRAVFVVTADELSEDDALERLLNPAQNRYRLDTLNVSYHSPLMRTLQHASYAFRKRLSHTDDSQDQRHRMVPGSRPLLAFVDTRHPD